MISTPFRFMLKNSVRAAAAAAVLLLAACSPEYNWRELDVADGRVRAAFPARVQTETRELALGGQSLQFSLTAAQVNRAVYAVGYAPLPPGVAGDAAASQDLARALVQSLHANLGRDAPEAMPSYGHDIEVHGEAVNGGPPSWLLARVWVADGMLIEAVAAGAEDRLDGDKAREFIDGVRVHR